MSAVTATVDFRLFWRVMTSRICWFEYSLWLCSLRWIVQYKKFIVEPMGSVNFASWIDHTKLPTWCTEYYLLVKYYYSPLHVSSIKYSSSGGHWYSKHVEESNNIWRINNIQCITLVVLYGQFMMHGQRNIRLMSCLLLLQEGYDI